MCKILMFNDKVNQEDSYFRIKFPLYFSLLFIHFFSLLNFIN